MTDPDFEKQSETQIGGAKQACPVRMYDGRVCGRRIQNAVCDVDKERVCLMHSQDPNKDEMAFQSEFDRIVRDAGEGIADFTRFVFPSVSLRGREFKPVCVFSGATFTQAADFKDATFAEHADFRRVRFRRDAVFIMTRFARGANLSETTFAQAAYFVRTRFSRAGDFTGATFTQRAEFLDSTFAEVADFRRSRFAHAAEFGGVAFAEAADFSAANLEMEADFRRARFKERAQFRETKFREDSSAQPGPVFGLARFEKPELVTFYKTYLGQALFHDCDVSKFVFSAVRWRQRANGKSMVLEEDEKLDTRQDLASALRNDEDHPDRRNYTLIAELYQQLKKNYDDRRDYWTAGDFHYGEMEMKRLHSPYRNKAFRWLHQNLGLCAWYKYASDYGENYVKPFARLVIVLLLFSLAYPACGLRRAAADSRLEPKATANASSRMNDADEISYGNYFQFVSASSIGASRATANFLGQSLWTSVGVAALQRDFADYKPATTAGRVASLFELLLTSTLVALILLAVRRQFRR